MRHACPPSRLALAAALLLCGCATRVVPPPSVPPPVPPAQPSAAAPGAAAPAAATGAWAWSPEMNSAAARLRSALRGSNVEVVQTTDQRLWLSLPGDEVFAAGRAAVAPAARGWLDEVAQALRAVPRAEVQIVAAPDAKGGGQTLALDRAASARDWMVFRGVAARRLTVSAQAPRPARAGTPPPANRLEILIGDRGAAPAQAVR